MKRQRSGANANTRSPKRLRMTRPAPSLANTIRRVLVAEAIIRRARANPFFGNYNRLGFMVHQDLAFAGYEINRQTINSQIRRLRILDEI